MRPGTGSEKDSVRHKAKESRAESITHETAEAKTDIKREHQHFRQELFGIHDRLIKSICAAYPSIDLYEKGEDLLRTLESSLTFVERKFPQYSQDRRALGRQCDEYEEENKKLRSDLGDIQRGMLTNVDGFQPETDSSLKTRFEELGNRIAALTKGINTADFGEALGNSDFANSVPKRHRKFLVESRLWEILSARIFCTPFALFGESGNVCSQLWMELFSESKSISFCCCAEVDSLLEISNPSGTFTWPCPSELCEKWRYTTFERIQEILSEDEADEEKATALSSHQIVKGRTCDALSDVLSRVGRTDRGDDIQIIVDQACAMVQVFGTQRCRVQLVFVEPGKLVKVKGSSPIANENDDLEEEEGEVNLVIAPGLRKWGDGQGGSLDQKRDVCPVRVYLRAA